jgi:hypothetical protein
MPEEENKQDQGNRRPPGVRPESGQDVVQPTIGRIVIYHFDGKDHPAIITAVDEDWNDLDLTVFFHGGLPHPLNHVKRGDCDGDWSWPKRV